MYTVWIGSHIETAKGLRLFVTCQGFTVIWQWEAF